MRLFGRKANEQSASGVPPELQEYYRRPGARTRLRSASLLILPLLAFLAVLGVVIGGAVWLQHHKLGDVPRIFSRQAAKLPAHKTPKRQPAPSTQQAQPAPQPPSAGQHAYTETPPATSGGSAANPIPKTGPESSVFGFSAGAAIVAAAMFHMHQLRRSRPKA